MQPQGDDAHGQHDGHGFDQHMDELVDRRRHRHRLVLDLHQFHAGRQLPVDFHRGHAQRLAERDDVAALGHRDAKRHDFTALVAYLDRWRIDVAATDVGNVVEPQLVARTAAYRHSAQLVDVGELPCHTNLDDVERRLDRACAFDRVLCADLLQHCIEIEAELRHAFLRNLDVDLFVLDAELFDLGNVLDAQEALANVVGKVPQLGR